MARSLEAIDVVTTLADIAADEVAGGAIVALSAEADAAFTTAPAHPGDERVRVRAVAHRHPDRQQALNDLVGRTIDTSAPFDTRAAEFPLWSRGRILGVLVVGDGTCSDDQRELLPVGRRCTSTTPSSTPRPATSG